jgi:hypothetical protein
MEGRETSAYTQRHKSCVAVCVCLKLICECYLHTTGTSKKTKLKHRCPPPHFFFKYKNLPNRPPWRFLLTVLTWTFNTVLKPSSGASRTCIYTYTCEPLRTGPSGDRIPVEAKFYALVQPYSMDTGSYPEVKRPGRGVDHSPPSIAEVEEKVELDFYSHSGPSWHVLMWTFTLFTYIFVHTCMYYVCLCVCVCVCLCVYTI